MSTEYSMWCAICGFRHNRPPGQTEHAREKACGMCGVVKPLAQFPRSNGSWDGHRHACVQCVAAEREQTTARKAEVAAQEAAKPLLLVLPDFPAGTPVDELAEPQRKLWLRTYYLECHGCGSAIPAVKRRSAKGVDFEECHPFSVVHKDVYGYLWASEEWYCSEICYQARRRREAPYWRRKAEEAEAEYAAFRS